MMSKNVLLATVWVLLLALSLPATAHRETAARAPLVIGHRGGGNGYLPEHTLAAYALGIELGADYIEADLVATKDGHLIARHEPNISQTTNVGDLPAFAARRRTILLDGVPETGFFTSDFTLAEIRKIRAIQAFPERGTQWDGQFGIPTLPEIIELLKRKSKEKGRRIGLYLETKHPTYHQRIGLPLEDRMLAVLGKAGLNHHDAPVFIESFETANLRYLNQRTSLHLVQLADGAEVDPSGNPVFTPPLDKPYDWVVSNRAGNFGDLLTPTGLAEVATYADGIGPWKPFIRSSRCTLVNGICADLNGDGLVNDADRVLLPPSDLVQRAHALGLTVHPFTFRSEQRRLASDFAGKPAAEYLMFYELGVDGVFSDFVDDAVAARVLHLLKNDPAYATCLVEGRCRGRR